MNDPNDIYMYVQMRSMAQQGESNICRTFMDATETTPKMTLMAAVLAGWMASAFYINERARLTETEPSG